MPCQLESCGVCGWNLCGYVFFLIMAGDVCWSLYKGFVFCLNWVEISIGIYVGICFVRIWVGIGAGIYVCVGGMCFVTQGWCIYASHQQVVEVYGDRGQVRKGAEAAPCRQP